MSATPQQVKAVIDQYIEAWKTGNLELLLSIFAEDSSWEDPVGSPPFVGHEGVKKFWDFAHPEGGGRHLTPVPHQIIACGSEGILRFTMQVRIPATNQGLDLEVTDHFVLDDAGKIRKARAFWDENCVTCPEGLEMFVPDMSDAYS